MYTNKNPSSDIMDLIEGFDIFNSEFLVKLDLLECKHKTITKNEGRLDLLTLEHYGNWNNYGTLGIKNRVISKDELKIGSNILVPTQNELDNINLNGG